MNTNKRIMAVIGTASRGTDAYSLSLNTYMVMLRATLAVAKREKVTGFVSGGAAWADHCAVQVWSEHINDFTLSLWFPTRQSDKDIAAHYHKAFSRTVGIDTWGWLQQMERSLPYNGLEIASMGGFKDRNTKVAEEADVFLAMTFGCGSLVKDGGTADTVRKMLARGITGYHLDLNTLKLHPNARA